MATITPVTANQTSYVVEALPLPRMTVAKLRQVGWVWGLSLLLAALLAAAGAHWPAPLPPRADAALALVLLPPLLPALWLLARRPQPAVGGEGESHRTRESAQAEQETH